MRTPAGVEQTPWTEVAEGVPAAIDVRGGEVKQGETVIHRWAGPWIGLRG